jgi:hypothetical protein
MFLRLIFVYKYDVVYLYLIVLKTNFSWKVWSTWINCLENGLYIVLRIGLQTIIKAHCFCPDIHKIIINMVLILYIYVHKMLSHLIHFANAYK